jgi:mannose-6-phosphate isomerase
MVLRGQAVVTLEGREIPLSPGQSVDIPQKAAHRIFNPGKELLTFIEIQTGEYFGEDDITRLEDDFGRASER